MAADAAWCGQCGLQRGDTSVHLTGPESWEQLTESPQTSGPPSETPLVRAADAAWAWATSRRTGSEQPEVCPRCGSVLAAGAEWCGACGQSLIAPVVIPGAAGPSYWNAPRSTNGGERNLNTWWRSLSRWAKVGTGVAIVVAILALAAIGGSSHPSGTATGTPGAPSDSTPPNVALATGAPTTVSPTGITSPGASATSGVVSASPLASGADSDDETSGGAGSSFSPDATGVLLPAGAGGSANRLSGEPDSALTPGALNPAVAQATINSTICVSGWTATIRPSESFTDALKVKQIGQYGYSDTRTSSYEEDHLVSLELGGAPADARNLWPEPYPASLADGRPTGARTKDTFETKLKDGVCAGTITLAVAQADIGDHWVHAYYGISFVAATASSVQTAAATPAPTIAKVTEPTPVPTEAPTAGTPTPVPGTRRGAVCKDGTSSDATGSGACSRHGGVDHWLYW